MNTSLRQLHAPSWGIRSPVVVRPWCNPRTLTLSPHTERRTRFVSTQATPDDKPPTPVANTSSSLTSEPFGPFKAKEVTDATWDAEVLKSDVPVFVDFWAQWCGPCRMIGPTIDTIIDELGDKFKAVKLNTDQNPSIASEYGIRSIPTVMIFKGGKKMDTIIGAVSKSVLKNSIEKYSIDIEQRRVQQVRRCGVDVVHSLWFSPLDDRLHALTQEVYELPEIKGVALIRDGVDAGLYQIVVPTRDGSNIALGRSTNIEKASEIHDMVAIGLHGCDAVCNFDPMHYHVDAYLNVLLTFRKLFPGSGFWSAVKRGLDAGVRVDARSLRHHPILDTFFAVAPKLGLLRSCGEARWPPFCPWMLSRNDVVEESMIEGSESSMDERRYRRRRVYHVPRNGVVSHSVMRAFVPPKLVIDDESDLRKTRRGRCVKQPVRYREDNLSLSDSDLPDQRSTLFNQSIDTFDHHQSPVATIPAISVVKPSTMTHPNELDPVMQPNHTYINQSYKRLRPM